MPLSIPADDLLLWNEQSATHWHTFLNANPTLLTIPCDIGRATSVATLFQHIIAVELRYAQRLASQPESDYADVPYALFATHTRALDTVRTFLADPTYDWLYEVEFQTISMGNASLGASLLYAALDQGQRLDWWHSGTFVALVVTDRFLF